MTPVEPEDVSEADLQILMAPLVVAGWKVREIMGDYDWELGRSLMGARAGRPSAGHRAHLGRVDRRLLLRRRLRVRPDSPGEPPLFRVHSAEELVAEYVARGWLEPSP